MTFRYTVRGTVALGASLPRWGSNGTANFSSTEVPRNSPIAVHHLYWQVILDAVIPRENRAQVTSHMRLKKLLLFASLH